MNPSGNRQLPHAESHVVQSFLSSLALNLLIGGLVGGAVLSSGWRRPPPALADRMVAPIIQALSRADRRAIGHAMRQNFRNPDADGNDIKQEFMPLINALRAVPYVSDEVEKALWRKWHRKESARVSVKNFWWRRSPK
ncbi:MAG: periplasmic heavy metal sensor [Rhodobacterales bacterium]|nr:periplasmic heavy metal sensor [Rhodobacterales bacterium]